MTIVFACESHSQSSSSLWAAQKSMEAEGMVLPNSKQFNSLYFPPNQESTLDIKCMRVLGKILPLL